MVRVGLDVPVPRLGAVEPEDARIRACERITVKLRGGYSLAAFCRSQVSVVVSRRFQ